jgi:hypothetical protein
MQKLFDAAVDYPLVLPAANEEFAGPHAVNIKAEAPRHTDGWNAFEIWRSRILPGVTRHFLPSL